MEEVCVPRLRGRVVDVTEVTAVPHQQQSLKLVADIPRFDDREKCFCSVGACDGDRSIQTLVLTWFCDLCLWATRLRVGIFLGFSVATAADTFATYPWLAWVPNTTGAFLPLLSACSSEHRSASRVRTSRRHADREALNHQQKSWAESEPITLEKGMHHQMIYPRGQGLEKITQGARKHDSCRWVAIIFSVSKPAVHVLPL